MKVYQIFFDESQVDKLCYTPYYNENCTVFFENSVIKDLVLNEKHKESDYFGVVSYQLTDKIGQLKNRGMIKNIANHSDREFSKASFERVLYQQKPDAISFQRHIPHDPVTLADRFHPNFSKYFAEIMKKIGYNWSPMVLNDVFYCNYFVAKTEIYDKYCTQMLFPAMEVMKNMPELMENSRYPKPLADNLRQSFGVNHYPYHAFLCERMFSYFAHVHKLKCLHY